MYFEKQKSVAEQRRDAAIKLSKAREVLEVHFIVERFMRIIHLIFVIGASKEGSSIGHFGKYTTNAPDIDWCRVPPANRDY